MVRLGDYEDEFAYFSEQFIPSRFVPGDEDGSYTWRSSTGWSYNNH